LCRRLNEDKEGCKCVTKEKLKNKETFSHLKLRDPPESEVLNDLTRREAVLDNDKNTEKKRNVPKCRPACCPRTDCNVQTCPSCYAKMRRSPSLCPCVNIVNNNINNNINNNSIKFEGERPHLSQHIIKDKLSSIENILKDIVNDKQTEDDDDLDDGEEESPSSRPVPLCRPSCCPRADCTKASCSACYARMRRTPDLCPCVNTGRFSDRKY